jgi:hypothetical protein
VATSSNIQNNYFWQYLKVEEIRGRISVQKQTSASRLAQRNPQAKSKE